MSKAARTRNNYSNSFVCLLACLLVFGYASISISNIIVANVSLDTDSWRLNLGSATHRLCDLEQVI